MSIVDKYVESKNIWGRARVIRGDNGTKWTIKSVNKLTPEENGGKHHVFITLLDRNGNYLYDVPFEVTIGYGWEGMRPDEVPNPVKPEKKYPEPVANIPIYSGQKLDVWVNDTDFGTDMIRGLTADLPDEGVGNTYGHHSYLVVFQLMDTDTSSIPTPIPPINDQKIVVNNAVLDELDKIISRLNNLRNSLTIK